MGEITTVTWDKVHAATGTDQQLQRLISQIVQGFPEKVEGLDQELTGYWRVRKELSVVDGVILTGRRIVIPAVLRAAVLETLGSAHQGKDPMQSRARSSVY